MNPKFIDAHLLNVDYAKLWLQLASSLIIPREAKIMQSMLFRAKNVCALAILVTGVVLLCSPYTHAGAPGIVNYQGRVQANGADFTGTGLFKFALIDGSGTLGTLWSSDGTQLGVGGGEPSNASPVTVTKGLYSVTLGNQNGAVGPIMVTIPPAIFNNVDVRLRVWFNDGTNGSQLLVPDQRIAAAGYAMSAASADLATTAASANTVADGSITSAKINPTLAQSFVPAGSVLPFAGTVAPTGYLFCNGAAVSRTTYVALFTAIGTSHGFGNQSTTFNLPDYRGTFLRGVDGGINNDPDRAARTAMNAGGNTGDNVGSVQADCLQDHFHNYSTYQQFGGVDNSAGNNKVISQSTTGVLGGRASTETRPKNAGVNFIIKY